MLPALSPFLTMLPIPILTFEIHFNLSKILLLVYLFSTHLQVFVSLQPRAFENHVGKGANADNHYFLFFFFFQQCFLRFQVLISSIELPLTLSQTSPGVYVSAVLTISNFSFSHTAFYRFWELSIIFIKFKIVVCKFFHFGRVWNLLLGERVNLFSEIAFSLDYSKSFPTCKEKIQVINKHVCLILSVHVLNFRYLFQ